MSKKRELEGLPSVETRRESFFTVTKTVDPATRLSLEMMLLSQRPEFKEDTVRRRGRKIPPRVRAANRKKRAALRREELKLIKECGVIREQARQALNTIVTMNKVVQKQQSHLRDLQRICGHEKAKPGKKCPDCFVAAEKRNGVSSKGK